MALFLLRKRKSHELADPIDPEPVTEPGHLLVKKVPGDQSVDWFLIRVILNPRSARARTNVRSRSISGKGT